MDLGGEDGDDGDVSSLLEFCCLLFDILAIEIIKSKSCQNVFFSKSDDDDDDE